MIEDPEALGEDEPAPVRPDKANADGSSAAAVPEPRVAFQVGCYELFMLQCGVHAEI
jgi:hypothetical protein